MLLSKTTYKLSVMLPDGSIMTRADLPPPATCRWVASRKATVVRAVTYGLVTQDEALKRYALSIEELDEWRRSVVLHGEAGAKAHSSQVIRDLRRAQIDA